jgi:glycosyltransferase involved in cell wall biosynthesis
MKVVHIIPGSGGTFYCGNCLRDSGYVKALRHLGHDVVKIPMYLPLFLDEHDLDDVPVFYGAVSLYLKQMYPFLRKMPQWIENKLNSPPMLKFAAKKSGSTRASGLEDMTISMLKGEEGRQNEELKHMVDWMLHHAKPDIVHLSNALLIGLARHIKKKLNIPVVCSLQDEDQWIDPMRPVYREKIWSLMAERAIDIDVFVAVSDYYGQRMKKEMKLADDKVQTIYIGIQPSDYKAVESLPNSQAIGFMSRMSEDLGLGILVDAFIRLKKEPGFSELRLKITGGRTGDDKKFINKQIRKIRKAGYKDHFEIIEDLSDESRNAFLRSISVLSVPVIKGEAFGLYLPEALATGVPVVQPALGGFPEIIELTQGGQTYSPNTPGELANTLKKMLSDKKALANYGKTGRENVIRHFHNDILAEKMSDMYDKVVSDFKKT